MLRRELLAIVAGVSAWPVRARAQQPMTPAIGFLNAQSENTYGLFAEAFRRGLAEKEYVDRKNVTIEYRWASGHLERLSELAADLVHEGVDVIAATGGTGTGLVTKTVTASVPIVFTSGDDPVRAGLVANLNHPASNVTGISWFSIETSGKRLSLLHELVPTAKIVGMLTHSSEPESVATIGPTRNAARRLECELMVLNVEAPEDIDAAFPTLAQKGVGALIVSAGPFFVNRLAQIVALAAQYRIPASYAERDYVDAGGLMSYGNNLQDAYRRNGVYVGRILNGGKPADMPIDRATKFDLALNLKAAKELQLKVPSTLLASADEVVE